MAIKSGRLLSEYVNLNLSPYVDVNHLNYTLSKYEEELYQNQQQIKNMQEYIDTLHLDPGISLNDMSTDLLLDLRRKIDKELSKRKIEQI